jgi:hypothetical protein
MMWLSEQSIRTLVRVFIEKAKSLYLFLSSFRIQTAAQNLKKPSALGQKCKFNLIGPQKIFISLPSPFECNYNSTFRWGVGGGVGADEGSLGSLLRQSLSDYGFK